MKPRILVADDDSTVRGVLREALSTAGFEVEAACDGQECLKKIAAAEPDLVLLDVEMPILNGWETLEKIKADAMLRNLPVLMLTSRDETQSKVRGLELGANDYITKPFELAELVARCRAALRDTRAGLEANPLTRLPGNAAIEREILRRLESGEKFFVLYADLNNFKAFNDRYGFLRGDRVIQQTGRILLSCAGAGEFVGHIGGDDFIANTSADNAQSFCEKAIAAFDAAAPAFYDAADRDKGYIDVADRKGQTTRYPFVGLAIGGVGNLQRNLTSLGQISEIGAEMKKFAKKVGKSAFAFDRRKD